ncbi:hypothetical protein V7654_15045 [Bacillus sp. JJ1609]
MGRFEEAIQCPAGTAPAPRRIMKKPAVGLFHNSSAESEAPGTKINSLV